MSKQLRIWLFVLLSTLLTSTSLLAEGVITMTTSERVGEEIGLSIKANGNVTIEGAQETGKTDKFDRKSYRLTSQTITIRGDVTSLDCGAEEYRRWGLTSLDASGCTSLTKLKCNNNPLTSLDVSGCTALTELNCSWNRLTSLDVSGCTSLTELNCSDNLLTSLDVSKNTALTELWCSENQLTRLDVSKNTALTTLYCGGNQLTSLNVSGCTALKWLNCSKNRLTSLDVSGCTALTKLDCGYNKLTSLDVSKNTALTKLDCSRNQINGENMTKLVNSLPDRKGMLWGGSLVIVNRSEDEKNLCRPSDIAIAEEKNWGPYWENGDPYEGIGEGVIIMTTSKAVGEKVKLRIVANGDVLIEGVSEKPYLSDQYSKNYRLTSQTITIRGDVTELDCDYNQLTSLDLSGCTALTKLECDYNQLTSLDVSSCTALTKLECFGNPLTSLDVSKNTALTTLGCGSNRLTSLDLSKNTALTTLDCHYNQLTSLNVSKNTTLTGLYCYYNQLTSLDVSKNTALTTLWCSSNQLTSLDVSKNTALTKLDCGSNQLTNLDVSKNIALTTLWCYSNQLTSLDLSKNTALTELNCYSNQLTSLDLSKNTALTKLVCSNNRLTSLNLSNCRGLKTLKSYGNKFDNGAIHQLISSLPNRKGIGVGEFYVIDSNNNNTCYQYDVDLAKKKFWLLYHEAGDLYLGEPNPTFALTYEPTISGGSIIIKGADDLQHVVYGTELTINATPAEGYELTALTANGSDILATKKVVVTENMTIKATFAKKHLKVSTEKVGEGLFEVTGADDLNSVLYGTELTVSVTPATGYELTSLMANETDISASKKVIVKENLTIKATFTKKAFAVTLSKEGEGTLATTGAEDLKAVPYGTEVTIVATPATGYELKFIEANGTDITATKKVVVREAVAVKATFVKKTFAVELTKTGEGTITADVEDLNAVPYGTKLTITATPAEGYELVALVANNVDISDSKSIEVTEPMTITATFAKKSFAVTFDKVGEGTITATGADDLNAVAYGTELTIVATPAAGYELVSITAGGTDITASKKVVVTDNMTVKATFAKKSFAVSLTKEGEGTITATGASNLNAVAYGTELTINAAPATGYELVSITAGGADITASKKVVVTGNLTIKATFAKKNFAVTLTKEGEGTITATGASNLNAVPYGTELTIVATPDEGYELVSITAGGTDITATKKIVVKDNLTVKATFAKKNFAVSLTKEGEGTITATGASNLNAVAYGTELTINAKPATGYELVSITAGGVDITASKKVVVTGNLTVKATFSKKAFAVSLTKEGEGTITATGASNLNAVAYGTELTINATPATGYELVSITAGSDDITASKKVVVKDNMTVKATFVKKNFSVSLTKEGEGTITAAGATSLDAVAYGTELTINATPATGYELVSITAGGADITASKKVVVTGNLTVKATFAKKSFAVTFAKEGEGTITATGASDLNSVAYGTELTIVATPAEGYELQSLVAGGVDITATKKIVVKDNLTVKATFAKKNFAVSLTKEGEGTITATGASNLNSVAYGTELTINATPATGYELVSITAGGTDITATKKVVVTDNLTVKATFAKKNFAVTFDKVGEGTITATGASNLNSVAYGTELTIVAKPATGYELVSITAGGTDITATKKVVVKDNITITATFAKKNFAVTFDKEGEGTITATGASNLNAVAYGTELTINATPAEGYELQSLVAGGVDITATKKIVVKDNLTVKATFAKKNFAVSLTKEGEGTITATGASNLNSVAYGTELTINATPAMGYELVSITAGGTDITASKKVVVTDNLTVKATFAKKNFAVSLTKEGDGTITATGASNLNAVAYGTELTIVATPATGYELVSITAGSADITASKKVVVTDNMTVKAIFAKKVFAVSLTKEGEGTITATGASDLNSVAYGTELTINAAPATGYELVSITAGSADITASKKVVVTGNLTVKATFAKKSFAVSLTKEGEGTITATGASDLNSVAYGTELTINAAPATGYELVSITAGSADITASKKVVVTGNLTVKATFEKKSFAVTLTSNEHGDITIVEPVNLEAVPYGTTLTVKATGKNAQCVLTELTANGKDILATQSFVVTGVTEVKATFVDHTGVETTVTQQVKLYPNPATDYVIVEGVAATSEVTLHSMTGERLYAGRADSRGTLQIDLTPYADGVYLVCVAGETYRVVVRH